MRKALATLASAALVIGLVPALVGTAGPAAALDNGLATTPPMGFNDWNAFGCDVSEQLIEQTADTIVSSGMKAAGYTYVNIDDCWMEKSRDAQGQLVADPAKFPDGIKAVADYVHAKGLKLGIYEDAGTKTCAGYPGSLGHERQDAAAFAAWGADYLKYDWCNVPFANYPGKTNQQVAQELYTTMRDALAATGRGIVFSMCNGWDPTVQPWTWAQGVSNLWRTTHDISDSYGSMLDIFHQNVGLAPYAKPGAWNDPDMLEVGNGGMTDTEYRSHFSLWAEMAAPLIAGTDLRKATPATLAIYLNKEVIAVDQDPLGIQGRQVAADGAGHVLAKPLAGGDVAVALFNEGDTPATLTTSARAAGLGAAPAYTLRDLWAHTTTETAGTISAQVPAHGTVLLRVAPTRRPGAVPPSTTAALTAGAGWSTLGTPVTVTQSFTDNGRAPVTRVRLALRAPAGWRVTAGSRTAFGTVAPGHGVRASWRVTPAAAAAPITTGTLTGAARYTWRGSARTATATQTVHVVAPLLPPYRAVTAPGATAHFGQSGDRLGIAADGADVWTGDDAYGAVHLPGALGPSSTATVRVDAQQPTSDWAKSGLMVRDDITAAGRSAGYLILAVTPRHGIALQWDSDGDGRLDSSTTTGDATAAFPVWLRLVRDGSHYTGAYSTDGSAWRTVGGVTLAAAAPTQDAGVFTTSHSAGTTGESDFGALTVG